MFDLCFFNARDCGPMGCEAALCPVANSKVTLDVATWTGTNVAYTCTPCNAANNEYVTNGKSGASAPSSICKKCYGEIAIKDE